MKKGFNTNELYLDEEAIQKISQVLEIEPDPLEEEEEKVEKENTGNRIL